MLKGVKKVTAGQNDLNSHPNLGTPGKNGGGGEAERSKEGHSRPKWMEEERLQKNEKGYRIEALQILAGRVRPDSDGSCPQRGARDKDIREGPQQDDRILFNLFKQPPDIM